MNTSPDLTNEEVVSKEELTPGEMDELNRLASMSYHIISFEENARFEELSAIESGLLNREESRELFSLNLQWIQSLFDKGHGAPKPGRLRFLELVLAMGDRRHAQVYFELSSLPVEELDLVRQVTLELFRKVYSVR